MLQRIKQLRKTLLYAVVLTFVLGAGYSTFAQLTNDAYTVRTVHIFPSEISSNGWENVETLTFQNLDEYALLQEFNSINSATLDGTVSLPEEDESEAEEDQSPQTDENPSVEQAEEPSASAEGSSEVANEESVAATSTDQTEAADGIEVDAADDVQDSEMADPEVADDENDVVESPDSEPAQDQESEEEDAVAEQEPAQEEVVEETGTTTVLREVRGLFLLAIDTLTETFSSTSEATPGADEEEQMQTDVEVEQTQDVTFGFVADTETATSTQEPATETTTSTPEQAEVTEEPAPTQEVVEETEEEVSTSTDVVEQPVAETTSEASDSDDVASTTDAEAASEPAAVDCSDDCEGYVLRVGNFGFPIEEGSELSGAQLRMSFAAQKRATRELIPSFTMNYSFDGGDSWSTGGSIVIDDEQSNSINGGYYLFALPAITDPAALGNLQVELRYDDDPALVSELFVESVWLELFVLEPPTDPVDPAFEELLADDGYEPSNLAGDILVVSETEEIEFTFTDDNTDETLIIKSDQKTYEGLSEATTYFSVSNTSSERDEFALQAYFPSGLGEVTDLQVFNVNKPREAVIPEYRPYVYHCEAGWTENVDGIDTTQTIDEFSAALSATTSSSTVESVVESASSTPVSEEELDNEEVAPSYSCRDTSVVRSCESVEGDGTACLITQKVQDHTVTRYARGWDDVDYDGGEMPSGGLLKRAATFFGLAPQRKEVPDDFEGRVFTDQEFTIDPGETLYFKMDISFPAFSDGEYWIEAVGDSEYGILDPFWKSEWQYRMPIQIENPTGEDQTEFQVRLQLDSAITDFWDNIQADGDDIRFVQETQVGNLVGEAEPDFGSDYNSNWAGQVSLTIPSASLAGAVTDFPVYVDLSDIGAAFWVDVQSDGRDIRITESDGTTELPHELVSIDTGAETGELYFKASTLGAADETFLIHYGNAAATAYTPTDTFGAQNVWTNGYEAVYHFEGEGAVGRDNVGEYTDSTANGYDAEDDTAAAGNTGRFGDGVEFRFSNGTNGVVDAFDHLQIPVEALDEVSEYTITAWYQADSSSVASADHTFISGAQGGQNEIITWVENGTRMEQFINNDENNTGIVTIPSINDDVWHRYTFTYSSTSDSLGHFQDGSLVYTDTNVDTDGLIEIDANGLVFGGEQDGVDRSNDVNQGLNGFVDSLHISSVVRSDNWLAAEYFNQNSPNNFYQVNDSSPVNWYSTSWNGRQLFTVAGSAVSGDQTDFPVYLDLSILGSDFWARVASDGSDIRITTGDAVTELPLEVVSIDTGAETGEVYFKTDLSGGDNFYIYFDNEDAIAYERDDTYGSESVWTNNFRAVYHFEEEVTGINNPNAYLDSTSNQYHADDNVTDQSSVGLFGGGVTMGADVNDVIEPPNEVVDGLSDHTVSWWHNTTNTDSWALISGANSTVGNEFLLFFTDAGTRLDPYLNNTRNDFELGLTVGTHNNGLWQHHLYTGDQAANELRLYSNGEQDTGSSPDTDTFVAFNIPNGGVVIGQEQDAVNGSYQANQRMVGQLDEMRIAEVVRDATWAETEYANMNDPSAFFATSTVETLTNTEFVELDYWLQYFDYGDEETDVWVQIDDLPAEGTTIYVYYGNPGADAGSDELATFSYDTLTEVYYVVDDHGSDSLEVTSLVDNNQVQLEGGAVIDLNRGETTSFTSPDGSDGLSILGPISAVVAGSGSDGGDMIAPISFATTSFAIPTSRSVNEWFAYAPFGSTTVDIFEGASAASLGTLSGLDGTAGTLAVDITDTAQGADGDGAVVEATSPILLTHRHTTDGDGMVVYPPTTEDLYGVNSQNMHFSGLTASTDLTLTCSAGSGGTVTGIARGDQEDDGSCTPGGEGTGSAVRVSAQTDPVMAIQQADADGNESTVFWPEKEFGTQYALPRSGAYVAVVCSPKYGSVDVEMQNALGDTIETATCAPSDPNPGKVYFTNGTGNGDSANFVPGTTVVSTNGVPFYAIFEDVSDDQDEKNIQAPVQARKYGGDQVSFEFGAQEEANPPVYEQVSFGWYEDNAELTPVAQWTLSGGEFAGESVPITGAGAVEDGDVLRLRVSAEVSNVTALAGTEAFTLQYTAAEPGQCSLATDWYEVGQIGSTTAAFNGYNVPTIQDGTEIPSLLLASSTVAATYEERNYSDFIPSDIGVGEQGEWDWALQANNTTVNTNYCFRMIRAIDSQPFASYTLYPELETVGPPNIPILSSFFDNEKTTTLTPELEFVATDIAGDDIDYEVQIDNDRDFSSVIVQEDSASNFLLFEEADGGPDKAPFASGEVIRFNGVSDLTATTTYWWRVRASDPLGSATTSAWSEPFSFTIDTTLETSQWYQTTTEQFETNEFEFISASGGSVTGGNGRVTGTPIDFDDAVVGNAWGEAFWTDTETSGEILVQVQFNNNGNWQPIPNSEIPGNNLGTTTSPINLLQLDTDVYNELRLVANFTGTGLSLDEWGIAWALRVETPVLGDLFDNQQTADTLPVFDFISSDPQGDAIEYEISFSTDRTFESSSSTFNSATDPGFQNDVSGSTASPFVSGNQINYTTQPGDAFTDGQTYWWRARAKDVFPGGDVFSPWSEADSFTIDAATTLSTWFQTTDEQFDQGLLVGTQATSGNVEISTDIGEFGTVDLTGNTWVQIPTERTYRNMVVIASSEFDFSSSAGDGRTARVRNKTANSFELKVDNHLNSLSGPTTVDYIVLEAGEWIVDDGGAGVRLLAGTATDVTEKQVSTYSNTVGQTITFPTDFGTPPTAFVTISSNNDSDWVDAHVDGGGNRATEVPSDSMRIALAVGNHTSSVHAGPEDIDYLAVGTGTGTIDGNAFQSVNTNDGPQGFGSAVFQQPLTGFTSAPAVTIVQNNAEDGGQGGFAFKDLQGTNSNTSIALSVAEIGVNADGHTDEVVSLLAFEDASGIISRVNDGTLTGEITGEPIIFTDGSGPKFDNFSWIDNLNGSGVITYQMQYKVSDSAYALIPDAALPGNSTGFTTSPIDLTTIDVNVYDEIRPFADLECVAGDCPEINSWKLEWSEGVNMSGTLQEYDRMTSVTSGSISASVNGGPVITGGVVTGGTWTLPNVTAFAGDLVTVWVDGAATDADRAVGAFVYDGLGDITDVALYEQHLSFDADEFGGSITNQQLGQFDNTDDSDIFFEVDAFGNLDMCASGVCADANIYIADGQTYIPATSTAVTIDTHDFINNGTIELDSNTYNVSGSWVNTGTSTIDVSTVNMTASAGTESITSTEDPLVFHNLGFGGFGMATFTVAVGLDLSGDLTVATGTLDRAGLDFTVGGSINTLFGGVWEGTGTTTFDGSGAKTWSDANPVPNNIGNVIIDGPSTIVTVASDVSAYDVVIGSNDTLVGGSSNVITVAGDWFNDGTFTPETSTVEIVVDDRVYPPALPGSSDWYVDTAFNSRVPVVVDSGEVSGDLTNFPLYIDLGTLGDDFWSTVQSDGRDIRITAGDGQTELPYELVEIDYLAETGELHFLADSVSGSVDTTFYVYFDNPAAAAYAPSATYGSQAVWREYEAVYHFSDDPTLIANTVQDSSANDRDLVVTTAALATTTGVLGTAFDLEGNNGYLFDTDFSWTAGDDLITSGWYFMDNLDGGAYYQWGTNANPNTINLRPWSGGGAGGGNGDLDFGDNPGFNINPRDPTNWHQFFFVGDATSGQPQPYYVDAIQRDAENQTVNNPSNSDGLSVGRQGTTNYYDALIDEFRIATTTRNTDWIEAEYVNQLTPTIFYSTSSVDTYQPPVVIDEATHNITTGGSAFYNLVLNDASTTPAFTEPSVVTDCDFTIATGTVALPTGKLTVGCSFTNNGVFMHNNAEVEFDGVGSHTITLNGTAFLNAFYDVTFDGTGDWTFLDTNATTTNDVSISDGTVIYPTGEFTIGGTLNTTGGGAFDANGGSVSFVSEGSQNVTTNGSSFNDVMFGASGDVFAWYDAAWSSRENVTISAANIDETLVDFPVYVDLSEFTDDFWSGVSADGADIRVTTANGQTELPFELVSIDTGSETGELHFKADTISDVTDTTFYVYFDNATAEAYEPTDTYGRNNVWTNGYEAVFHLEESASGVVGEYTDSTGNGYDAQGGSGVSTQVPAQATGLLGSAQDFENAGADIDDDYIDLNVAMVTGLEGSNTKSVSAWTNVESWSDAGGLWNIGGNAAQQWFIARVNNTNQWRAEYNSGDDTFVAQPIGSWQHVVLDYDGVVARNYVNAINEDNRTTTLNTQDVAGYGVLIGRRATANYFDGLIDEVRFSSTNRTAGWYAAEHLNQSDAATFYSTSHEALGVDAAVFTLNENFTDIDGDLYIEGVQLVAPLNTLTIGGSALNTNGAFGANNATTTFDSDDLGETVAMGNSPFYNLFFNGVGGGWTTATNTVDNQAGLITGASFVQSPNTTLTVNGAFSNSFNSAATTWTDSTLTLTGGDYEVTGRLDSGDDYANVEVSNDTDITIWNSTIASSTINDTSSIYMPDYGTTDGLLRIYGDFDRATSSEYWSYATDFDGTDLTGGSERAVSVEIADGSVVTVASTSALQIDGTSATTTVSAISGSYSLVMDGATIDMTGFSITDTDIAGFEMRNGANVSVMTDGEFLIATGTAITVDAATIEAQPSTIYTDIRFQAAAGTPANVTLDGVPAGYWAFAAATGDRAGEAFDADDGDPGAIQWDDSNFTVTISGVVYSDDGVTPMSAPVCNNSTEVVTVVVDGVTAYQTSCDPLDGSYEIAGVTFTGDPSIVAYIDSSAATPGVAVGITDQTSGSGAIAANTITMTRPAVSNGTVLVAIAGKDDDNGTFTPPVGWTTINTLAGTVGDQNHTGAWYKVVSDAGTEPATYDFGMNDNGESYSWWMGTLVNVDTITPLDVASTWSNYQNDIIVPAASVTSVTNGALAIASWYVADDNDVSTVSTDWSTVLEDLIGSDNNGLTVQTRNITTAGATGDPYITNILPGNETNSAQFVFRPAGTVTASSSVTAAVVTKTPINTPNPYQIISIRDQRLGSDTVVAAGTIDIDAPAMENGDVLVAVIGKEDDPAVTAPAGWVAGPDLGVTAGTDVYSSIWYKVITDAGTEPSTYSFTNTGPNSQEILYWVGSFENVDTSNVFDIDSVWTNVQDTSAPTAPSITTVTDGAYVLAGWVVMTDNTMTPPGAPWTTLAEDLNISSRALNVVGQRFAASGATGDVTFTDGSTDDVNVGQFALRPAQTPPGSAISDFDLYQNRVIVRHEDLSPLSIADMTLFDNDDESDLPFTATAGGSDLLTVLDGSGLYVWNDKTFAPNGEIDLQGTGLTAADGSLAIGPTGTLTMDGSDPLTIGGSLYVDAGGTFDGAVGTPTFTSTNVGQSISAAGSSTINFYDLAFTGVGGEWAVQTPIVVDQNIAAAAGTIAGISDIEVVNGNFAGNGLVAMTGGTVQLNSDNTLGGTNPWQFNNLVLGDGTAGITTPAGSATTTVLDTLTISSGHFLDNGGMTLDLVGSGNVFIENGTFTRGTGTVRYSGTTPNVLRTTYNNLVIDTESGGSVTATAPGIGLQVLGSLTVGALGTSTLDLNSADPLTAVGGDVYIGTLGTLQASDASTLDVFGSYDNDGTFVANGGLVEFLQATGTVTVAAGNSSFGNVFVGGNSDFTFIETATTTGDFTMGTSQFTLQSGEVLSVGGEFRNNMDDSRTTWTGTTLRLNSGTAYEANLKLVGDTYNVIEVAAGTHPRFWNSDAASFVTATGGSVYSQDHDGVDGDLHIYGDFVNTDFDDHWSYSTDWDGTALASERQANVLVEDGGSVKYSSGSLTVLGTTTASTTISAIGAGPYDMTLAGDSVIDMRYYSVRDIAIEGLTFTGTPTVNDLSFGDFEVAIDGGSGITVGGSVISANPAQNYTNNRFATTTAINAFNVTATGTSLSSWRFVNVDGNLDGEAKDVDPGGDPGYVVWQDSAAIIDISGVVYQSDRTTVSTVCDGVTENIRLSIQGLTFASTTCAAGTGAYTFPGIGFGPSDTLTVYISGETQQAAVVTKDPISLISDMDLYENHVIVRHESGAPQTIESMAAYDSSDDADIPFTAVDAVTDTLALPADFALVVWTNKDFEPGGDVTIAGGGAGASYDGLLELFDNSDYIAATGETHSVGGSALAGSGALIAPAQSTFNFTSTAAGRTIDLNEAILHDATFSGSGDWTITDPTFTASNDVVITAGTLTLPAGTSTIGGSFDNTAGTFDANGGLLYFTSADAGNTVEFGGSEADTVVFDGIGSWTFADVNATTTDSFTVATGTVTLPSGTLTVSDDFVVNDTIAHNGGNVQVVGTAGGNIVTLNGNDLTDLTIVAVGGDYTLTDPSAALLGSLTLADGTFTVGTGTVSIGGSFDVSGGVYNNGSGTLLFNSTDGGEFIDAGSNDLYNVVVAGAGGWTLLDSATTTNNFAITNAGTFAVSPGSRVYVGNVFTNNVGGAATTWTGTTLVLDGANQYEMNVKATATELYDTLTLGENTDISSWNTSATTLNIPSTSSFYSQDHAGADGDLYIFGDYNIGTTTEYWSAETDFDGVALGSARQANVYVASSSAVTLNGGALEIIGTALASTSIQSQGVGTFDLIATDGTLNANFYNVSDLTANGLDISGSTNVTSLSNGYFTQNANNTNLITLVSGVINNNASLVVTDTGFAAAGFTGGVNVSLDATTTNSWSFTGSIGDLWGEAFDVDGTDDCSSLRWDDSSCLLTEQTNYRWRNDDGGEGVPDTEWFDTDWSSRQRVRVINDDVAVYTNTAVKIPVSFDADMQSDFEDLRFTDSDGVTLVDHWIERFTSGSEAVVWIEAPTLAADSVSEFYMYYGNVTATSTSDGSAVFEVIEDFEDDDLSEYAGGTGDLARFETESSLDNGAATYGGGFGLRAVNTSDKTTDGIIRDDVTVTQGQTIRFMQYIDTTAGAGDEVCTIFAANNSVTDNDNYAICTDQIGTDRISIVEGVENSEFSGTILGTANADFTDPSFGSGWYEFYVDWETDNTIDVAVYFESTGELVATTTATDATYTSGGIGFAYWFQNGGWDSFVAYPRTETLPTVFLGDEQSDGGATWANPQNTPTGGFLTGETARLRLAVENSGLPIEDQQFELEFAPKLTAPTCEAVSGGDFTPVPNIASCGSSAVCMATSLNVSDGDTTTDHLLTTGGDFVAGEIVTSPSNNTALFDLDQNRYTELEYALQLTANANNDSYCFRVTDDGDQLDSYSNLPELTLAFDPVISGVTLNDGLDITLAPGATTTVIASSTVTDFNGFADIASATTTFYKTSVGAACTPDDNNCYVATSSCSFVNCSGNSCSLLCEAPFAYHTDPTDADGAEEWFAFMEVSDIGGASSFGTSIGLNVLTLRALDVQNAIAYGTVDINEDTGTFNPSVSLLNLGNESLDVQVAGTDMTDGITSIIPASQQRYSTSTFDYAGCVGCSTLSVTGADLEVDLDKPLASSPVVSDDIYWGIEVPFGTASAPHTGVNFFMAITD